MSLLLQRSISISLITERNRYAGAPKSSAELLALCARCGRGRPRSQPGGADLRKGVSTICVANAEKDLCLSWCFIPSADADASDLVEEAQTMDN